jgi:hypothetical protein
MGACGCPQVPCAFAGFFLCAEAFAGVGITLSVSPGTSMNPLNGSYVASHGLAAQYRVTNDFWDVWDSGGVAWPTDLRSKFGVFSKYADLIGANNSYPDGTVVG